MAGLVAAVAAVAAAAGAATVRGPSVPPVPPVAWPATPTTATARGTPLAGAEREQRLREERPGSRVYDLAAETRDRPVELGGRLVQLPPDAYIEGVVVSVSGCTDAPTPCPETPFYNIRRGRSLINVTVRTGRIVSEHLAPGEEEAFTFLKAALR